MKKSIILFISFLAVACLSLSAYAQGWANENGTWVYYDSKGDKVTDQWEKSGDGYYYLDSSGHMAVSTFIYNGNNERYVDSDGRMVTSAWRQIGDVWYYFNSNGYMLKGSMRKINDKYYYFGEDGVMLTGWIEQGDDWLYANPSDGHLIVGAWVQLEPASGMYTYETTSSYDGLYGSDPTETYWFYFQSNGLAARADDGSDYKEYLIGSERYAFDRNGLLCTGWIKLKDTDPVIKGYKYFNDDESLGTYGAAHTGWLSTYPPRKSGTSLGSAVVWYYFNSSGVPYCEKFDENESEQTLEAKFKRITKDGKTNTYLFNEYGNPVYGLRRVKRSNGDVTSMYFGTSDECCLQYGETRITEVSGEVSSYHFSSSGYGTTGVYNGKLYYMGKLQKANGTQAFIEVNDTVYLVSSSGNLIRNRNYSKRNDANIEYASDSRGVKAGGSAPIDDPIPPEFNISEV